MKIRNKVTSKVYTVYKVQAEIPTFEWQQMYVRFLIYKDGKWTYVSGKEYEAIEEKRK